MMVPNTVLSLIVFTAKVNSFVNAPEKSGAFMYLIHILV